MEQTYAVRKLHRTSQITVTVPGSKSITNRALMLAAMSDKSCLLEGVLFSDDSRAFLDCLQRLGFQVEIHEEQRRVRLQGTGGRIPNMQAEINVRSAGTAARFLTVLLALAGGDYVCKSSAQMAKRPMQPLLTLLENSGVTIGYLGEEGHFPFVLRSHAMNMRQVEIDTTLSSQFASALLMAGTLLPEGLRVSMKGSRTAGSYIKMTLAMMKQFGIAVIQKSDKAQKVDQKRKSDDAEQSHPLEQDLELQSVGYEIPGRQSFGLAQYTIEPDISGACYFYSMAPLLGIDVLVRNVHENSLQGDIRYVQLMQEFGCTLEETAEGLLLHGAGIRHYPGITVNMKDFSDQTMTLAALAVYADSPTEITDIGHIKLQESDRMAAILTELSHLGIACEELPDKEGIRICPGHLRPGLIHTYEDHRIAMAFTLLGLRSEGLVIDNPGCCGKTFENYFNIIDSLYESTSCGAEEQE